MELPQAVLALVTISLDRDSGMRVVQLGAFIQKEFNLIIINVEWW